MPAYLFCSLLIFFFFGSSQLQEKVKQLQRIRENKGKETGNSFFHIKAMKLILGSFCYTELLFKCILRFYIYYKNKQVRNY